MKWLRRITKQAQSEAKPPSYLVERQSDLQYASSMSTRSPREAQKILLKVADQFDEHLNYDYAGLARGAAEAVLDSPSRAKALIRDMIQRMEMDREEYEDG